MNITDLVIKVLEESSDEEAVELANRMIALRSQMHSDPEDYVDKKSDTKVSQAERLALIALNTDENSIEKENRKNAIENGLLRGLL